MIHSILRNLQKAFFLSAAVLMLFAFDQLKHFDVEYFSATGGPMTAGGELHHPSYLLQTDSSEEDDSSNSFRIGASHQLMFGKEIKIGLFRFVLPRLELTTPSPEQYQQVSSSSRTILNDSREALRKKKNKGLTFRDVTKAGQKSDRKAAVTFVADFQGHDWLSCSDALHEAQILRQSLLTISSHAFGEPWNLLLPRNCTRPMALSLPKRSRNGYRLAFDGERASKHRNNATKAVCWTDLRVISGKEAGSVLVKIPGGLFFDEINRKAGPTTQNAHDVPGNDANYAADHTSNATLYSDPNRTVEWLHVDNEFLDGAERDNTTNCPTGMQYCHTHVDCKEKLSFLPSNVVLRSWNVPSCASATEEGCRAMRKEDYWEEHGTDEVGLCAYTRKRYCNLTQAAPSRS